MIAEATVLVLRGLLLAWGLLFAAAAITGLCWPSLLDSEPPDPPPFATRLLPALLAFGVGAFLALPPRWLAHHRRVGIAMVVVVITTVAFVLVRNSGRTQPRWLQALVLLVLPLVLQSCLVLRARAAAPAPR